MMMNHYFGGSNNVVSTRRVAHNGLLIYIMIKVVETNLLSLACHPANVTYGLSQLACPAIEIFYVRLGGGVFNNKPLPLTVESRHGSAEELAYYYLIIISTEK